MSSTSRSAFNAPPLPRYRYHHKTGTWRKEKVQSGESTDPRPHRGTGAVHTTTAGAAPAAAVHLSSQAVPFESSYDYFLRAVKPPAPRRTQAEREARRRDATRVPIRDFEAALFKNQSVGVGGRRLRVASDAQERSSSGQRAHKSVESTHAATAATTSASPVAAELHPFVGYASAASMPAVYTALSACKPQPLNFTATPTLDDRLSRAEFHALLSAIGPVGVLSTSYEDAMFHTLPSYAGDTDTVEALAVLTLLLDHRYHPQFNANVAALFRSFDVEDKGVIALEALHPDVLTAWAEMRTYGNLREQWNHFAAVMEEEMNSGAVRFPHVPELVPRNVVRALLICTEALYAAACSLDLDGGSL
jgi:hypothetical protein